jgi:hypothetical protein
VAAVRESRVQREFLIESGSTDDKILDLVERALSQKGFDVRRSGDGLVAKQGSQLLTRLLGTWSVSSEGRLPKAVEVSAGDGRNIRVRIRETLGFGYFDWRTREKYELHFAQLERAIRESVAGAPPNQ